MRQRPGPTFSVVICNYNYAQYIAQAIDSALAQDYPAEQVEVVVVDDGSTDGSREVLERYRGHPQVRLVFQPNCGQTGAFDAGVRAASNDLVCLLDSDDLCLPGKLSRIAGWVRENGAACENLFLCHDLTLRDERNGQPARDTWFGVVGIDKLGETLDLDGPPMFFPFSVPAGQVFGRALLRECLAAIPPWVFPRGADGVLCPAALIRSGRVHYLRESLGIYRIHAANEFASLTDGRYTPRIDLRDRTPRQLHFLDQWVDLARLTPEHRTRARGYFRRWERLQRSPAPDRGVRPPLVSIALVGHGDADALARSTASALDQRHPRCELLLPADLPLPTVADAGTTAIHRFDRAADASALAQIVAAAGVASGESIVFLPVGDRLDRDFIDRHLFYRQYGALVGVTCSDIRLVTQAGELVHQNAFAQSGAWAQQVQQIPPFATGLAQWVAPPLAACLFRRDLLADLLADLPGGDADAGLAWPDRIARAGGWLPLQLTLHTCGLLRFRETLSSVALHSGAQASYGWLSAPHGLDGALVEPTVEEGAAWFRRWHAVRLEALSTRLPAAWHQRFAAWLDAQRG